MTTLLDEAHTPEEIADWWQRFGLDHAAARQQREAAYAAQKAEWERIRASQIQQRLNFSCK